MTNPSPSILRHPMTALLALAGVGALGWFAAGRYHEAAAKQRAPAPAAAAEAQPAPKGKVPLVPPAPDTLPKGPMGAAVERGRLLVTKTKQELPGHVGNDLSCTNCHLQGGTVAGAAPWVGLAGVFPEYRSRNARVNTLEDRVNDCFERSLNGTPLPPDSEDMRAILAYITWLSRDVPVGHEVEGRGFQRIQPPSAPDAEHGKALYAQKCVACHGAEGQGTKNPDGSMAFPPLWGDRSFNIGAGMARLDTAAAFIHSNMPLGQGNTLSPQDAYDLAEFVIHQPRPDFAKKANDWPKGDKPRDARY